MQHRMKCKWNARSRKNVSERMKMYDQNDKKKHCADTRNMWLSSHAMDVLWWMVGVRGGEGLERPEVLGVGDHG